MNEETVNKIILLSSKEEKKRILKDISFRKKLFTQEGHYPFVWLIQGLSKEEVLYILDDDLILLLKEDKRKNDKLNAIITSGNSYVNEFLKKESIIAMIIDSYDSLKYFLSSLDLSFARAYFCYIVNNNLSLNYLEVLNNVVQLEIIKQNINIIKGKSVTISFLFILKPKSIEYLLQDSYFANILIGSRVGDIDAIIRKGITLPINLQTSSIIIDKYLQIADINNFYDYVNNLDNNYYLKEEIIKRRRLIYTKKINSIDPKLEILPEYTPLLEGEGVYKDFHLNYEISKLKGDKNKILLYLREVTITKMLEMTIDTFYQDLTYNFLKNLESMLSFISKYPKSLIPKERLEVYKDLLDYYSLDTIRRVELYNKLNNGKNHAEEFYDDFRSCRNASYHEIKDSITSLKEKEIVSTIDGINVYKYDGEDFKMIISRVLYPREKSEYPKDVWWKSSNKKVASLSLISDKNITTFGDATTEVILGFDSFNPDNIMITYHKDAFTSDEGSNMVQRLYTSNELIEETESYNEILISENYEELKPSYVVCYDEIKEGDIRASKLLGNIPLVIINTKKYNYKNKNDFSKNNYKYPSELYGVTTYRRKGV